MTVRTRIAPSPTGDPHVGTAYIALFNYCFAKVHGGQFLLRIEDTDQVRSTPESEQAILESLRWLGLDWDEGPDVGGDCGPYRQSERRGIYQEHAESLLANGHAFRCFCSAERLDALRKTQMEQQQPVGYDGHCLHLSQADMREKLEAGEAHVIRMKVPDEGLCVINDLLRGPIEIEWAQVDMQVLVKADGMPTYHLANVVDDHLMKITHVIRGEEWISSAPKHLLLYRYFGWEPPEFCHLPLLRNPDKSKLSKRKNPTSILFYRRMGYLPEALLNYLGRMGWSMPDEREKFTLAEMLNHFDLQRVSLGGPVFDVEKLRWLNGLWMRENFSADQLADALQAWMLNRENLLAVLPHIQPRLEVLSDIGHLTGFLINGMPTIKAADLEATGMDADTCQQILQFSLWQLDGLRSWERDAIFEALKALADAMSIKMKQFLLPVFVAVTGSASSFSIMDAMVLLGSDMSRARLRHALDVQGGVSGKKQKQLEKTYRALMAAEPDAP